MSVEFAGIITENSISFTGTDGKNHVISNAHASIGRIRQLVRDLQLAKSKGDDVGAQLLWEQMTKLADTAVTINLKTEGKISVRDGQVYFLDEVISNGVTSRILWSIREGYDPMSYVRYLERLMENPSKRAVDQVFTFIEHNDMGITDDGYQIAYKAVREDYYDIYSGTILNTVGAKISMRRNAVDENPDHTCAPGLHFCNMSYLPHYGTTRGGRVVIVKIDPRDIVAVPRDYNNAKARCCAYEVIGEYTGADLEDLLGTRPVWNSSDFKSDDRDDESDDEPDDAYDDEGAVDTDESWSWANPHPDEEE